MKEIGRAISYFDEVENLCMDTNGNLDESIKNTLDVCWKLLQSELARQENKALTLSEIKEMVGEPVWVQYPKFSKCKVIDVIEDDEIWFTTGDFIYIDKLDKIRLYKHKPNGGE